MLSIRAYLFLTFTAIATLNAQNYEWANSVGGSNVERGYAVAMDGNGNVFTTGTMAGTGDFDPSPTASFSLTSAGLDDIFVCKFDAAGNFLWAKRMGSTDSDEGRAIKTDASGNVYIAGWFRGTVDFDPNSGVFNITAGGTNAGGDAFICKLDAAGNFVWAKSFYNQSANGGGSRNYDITLDPSGNIYCTGSFNGTYDFDPSPTTTSTLLSTNSSQDIFVCKLNSAGNFVWCRSLGGAGIDVGIGITVDASGNALTTGNFMGLADFDPGTGSYTLTTVGGKDIFVSKLDPNGNFIWARSYTSTQNIGYCSGNSVTTDANGNVYLTGSFVGTVDFDPSSTSTYTMAVGGSLGIFVSKLDASGNFLWAKNTGGGSSSPYIEAPNDITIDQNSNVYVSGFFTGYVDLDPSPITSFTVNSANQSVFLSKFDNSGNFIWASCIFGNGGMYGHSLAIDQIGTIVCSGLYNISADFDPSPTASATLISNGVADAFVLKLNCKPLAPTAILGNTNVCVGSTNSYSIQPLVGASTYSWMGSAGWTTSSTSTSLSLNVPSTGTLSVYGMNTCGAGKTQTLLIATKATPTISSNSGSICAGKSFVVIPTGASTYTITGGNFTVSPTTTSAYSITGTSSLGCVSNSIVIVTVTVVANPTLSIASSATSGCIGESFVLSASGALSYTWSTNQTAAGISVSPTQATTYTVNGSNAEGCSSYALSSITVMDCTGIAEQGAVSNISIYPNPSSGNFYVQNVHESSINIINAFGETLQTITATSTTVEINLSAYPNGVYFLEAGNINKKIIKQ